MKKVVTMEINNRKAKYNYQIFETIECGIALTGTEIKSLRSGKANIKDSYATVKNSEVFLINMHISGYDNGNIFNHDETRTRKLLLHKKEILKLRDKITIEGYTLVPLKVYFVNGRAKVLIGVARGKKNYDKREDIKKKTIERELRSRIKR
ncbi:MAG: SsrA-binding protein SmpB [Bacilli bacterium]|nr:SsrA-binding protein SmpB [Bacilli bacterium]